LTGPDDNAVLDRAKALRQRIEKAGREIQAIVDREFKKTGVKKRWALLLVRFRLELEDPFAALLAILKVERSSKRELERHPDDRQSLEDLQFALEQKRLLFEAHSKLKEQMESEEDCPCRL